MAVHGLGDVVAALRALPGVAEADVEPDASGLGLLKLALTPGVDEVAVATEVGRLLRDRFDISVDAERVQLIEDAGAADPADPYLADPYAADPYAADPYVADTVDPSALPRPRPSIERMHLVSSGLEVQASVTLGLGGGTCVGESTGSATSSGVQRAVAKATLRAVEGLLGDTVRFELEHLEVTPMGRDRTAVVALTMLGAAGAQRLTGAAVVREDVRQAVIRATLDALNRRLETFLG